MREMGLWAPLLEASNEGKDSKAEQSSAASSDELAGKEETEKISETADTKDSEAPALKEGGGAPEAAIEKDAMESLIRWYCREAGVRNLQKHIEKICRKLAMRVVEHRE